MGLGGAPEDPEAEAPDALLWKSNLPNVGMQGPCALKDTTFRLSVLFCFVFFATITRSVIILDKRPSLFQCAWFHELRN